jgi:hypothetical protein
MSDVEAKPIRGTNVDAGSPFFSPDGQWVGFFSYGDSLLRKIAVGGGAPVTLCKVDAPWSATWDGDTIFVASGTHGIMRVPANGGAPEVVVKVGPGEAAYGPQVLGGGRLLYTLATGSGADRWDEAQIIVQSVVSGERHIVVRGGSAARYLATAPDSPGRGAGHLVYAVGNSLLAAAFDAARLELRGAPVPIVEPVTRSANSALQSGVAQYAVSATGTLAYLPGRSSGASLPKALAFAGRDGKIEPLGLPPQPYIHPRLSPDGRQLVVGTDDGKDANVWVYDLKSGGSLRRLTFGGRNQYPIWTRDGRFITFQSNRDGDDAIFRQPADGSGPAERLTRPDAGVGHRPESWSPDGKTLSINVVKSSNESVWTIATDSGAKPTAFADTSAVEKHSSFSPDGRWVAYMANTEGDSDIYIQPFPPTGAKYQIATGGRTPAWSPDGKQLFFHAIALNRFVVVDIRAEQGLTSGTLVPLPIDDASWSRRRHARPLEDPANHPRACVFTVTDFAAEFFDRAKRAGDSFLGLRLVSQMLEYCIADAVFSSPAAVGRRAAAQQRHGTLQGHAWTGRPVIYLLDYDNRPQSARAAAEMFRQQLAKIMVRSTTAPNDVEDALGTNLRSFDDYALFLNSAAYLFLVGISRACARRMHRQVLIRQRDSFSRSRSLSNLPSTTVPGTSSYATKLLRRKAA